MGKSRGLGGSLGILNLNISYRPIGKLYTIWYTRKKMTYTELKAYAEANPQSKRGEFRNTTINNFEEIIINNLRTIAARSAGKNILGDFSNNEKDEQMIQIAIEKLVTDESRYLLQVVLADAKTGIIKVLRAISFTPEMSQELYRLYQLQKSSDVIDQATYIERCQEVYKIFPKSEILEMSGKVKQQ
jgi:hypothetical protein